MAAFFGEIIHKESRAFVDDLAVVGLSIDTEILDPSSLDSSYELMLVTDGVLTSRFARTLMLDESVMKVACFYEKLTDSCEKPPSILYKLNNDALLFIANDTLDIRVANTLLLKLLPWLKKCSETIIFTSVHISKFRCIGNAPNPDLFIRCLASGSFTGERLVPDLEVSNFICNFSASVLSLCHVIKKSAVLYIWYSETNLLDGGVLGTFVQLVNKLGINELLKTNFESYNLNFGDILISSNMYI